MVDVPTETKNQIKLLIPFSYKFMSHFLTEAIDKTLKKATRAQRRRLKYNGKRKMGAKCES